MDFDIDKIEQLIVEWLNTFDENKNYWDGVYCSDQDMAKRFVQSDNGESFLWWLKNRDRGE